MNQEDIDFLIENYKLTLLGGRLCAFDAVITEPLESLLRPNREAIVAAIVQALSSRVTKFHSASGPGRGDQDPWRHTLPGLQRMAMAEAVLRQWQTAGLCPRVVWSPHVEVQSLDGRRLLHPTGCLPELLWLFSLEGSTDWCGQRLPSQSSGGVA